MLTISKLESSQATVNLHEVSLFEEVSRVMNDMERAARVKGVTLKIDIPDAIKVKADPGLLEQMIINLVDNAIKYGSTDGCVEVRGSFNGNGQICVSVKDDGPGIPPEALDRIFERFFRVDKARSRAEVAPDWGSPSSSTLPRHWEGECGLRVSWGREPLSFSL